MGDTVIALVAGAMVMGYAVAALFFLRFWKETRDRLFGIFGAAFLLLAVQRALLPLVDNPESEVNQVLLYGIRLLAFVLILVAIIDKNRSGA